MFLIQGRLGFLTQDLKVEIQLTFEQWVTKINFAKTIRVLNFRFLK